MTNAEKFKEVYGYEHNGCPHGKHCSEYDDCGLDCYNCIEEWWKSEYLGTPTIPLSVIEDIKAEIKAKSQPKYDTALKLYYSEKVDVLEIIDRKVNEVKGDKA